MKTSNKSNVILKSDLPWTKGEMWIRIIIYFIFISTFLFILQLGIGDFLIQIKFSSDKVFTQKLRETIIYSITGILGIITTWVFLKIDDRPLKQLGLFFPDRPAQLFLIAVLVTPIALLVGFIIENIAGIIDFTQMINNLIVDPTILIILTIVTLLGIGFGEEIMFRGYLQRVLESNFSFWKATAITSILFGSLHTFLLITREEDTLNAMVAVGISATAFGVMFAYAYYKTGRNLYFPMIIHGVWDIGIFIFNTEFNYHEILQVVAEIISQILAAAILIVVIYYYAEYFPPQKKLPEWATSPY